MPGRTVTRGYGHHHKNLRQHWAPLVATGNVRCWRCGQPIAAGEPWDLGHDDNNRSITRGPEHAHRCNRAAAGRTSAARRTNRKRKTEPHPGLRNQTTETPPG